MKLPRQATPAMRLYIRQRDGRCCQYCGTTTGRTFIIEHVIPAALGGPALPYNLVIACGSCNSYKGRAVWIPRNLDSITADHPTWRQQVLGYNPEISPRLLHLLANVTSQEAAMIACLSPEELRLRLLLAPRRPPPSPGTGTGGTEETRT